MTQEQLARQAGLNVRTIRRLESGMLQVPRATSLQSLAGALGLTDEERAMLISITLRAVTTTASESTSGSAALARPVPAPRQLPADVGMFIGRLDEIAVLSQERLTAVTAIDGMAGIGKTALAVNVAHQLAPLFPDGQLFVDLHGYTQGAAPVSPADALRRMLGALGMSGDKIPPHLDERAALYRSLLAERKVLIVLDNAFSEDQVKPLLPGNPNCRVFITSRRRLGGLDGTHTVSLDVLSTADAVTLFTFVAGHQVVADTATEQLAETMELCGLLPLAIRVAARRLHSRPSWSVIHLLKRMREQDDVLEELGSGQRSVVAALDLSYRELSADQQRAYRLMGLHPGTHLTADTVAQLLNVRTPAARRLLEQLIDVHLMQEPEPDCYRFHDLVREHAAKRAVHEERETDRRAALTRLFDYYSHTVTAAIEELYPQEASMLLTPPPMKSSVADGSVGASSVRWLETELVNLLAAVKYAAEHGWPDFVTQVSTTLYRWLRIGGHYTEAEKMLKYGLAAACSTEDCDGQLQILLGFGDVRRDQGRHQDAFDCFSQVLDIAQRNSHQVGELRALIGLGHLHRRHCRYEEASRSYERAIDIAQTIGRRIDELEALMGRGWIERLQGRHLQAIEVFSQGLDMARAMGYQTGQLMILSGLGHIYRRCGRYEEATSYFTEALALARAIRHRYVEVDVTTALGDIHRLMGRHEQAAGCYLRALEIAREIGHRNLQFEILQGLGRLAGRLGDPSEALGRHEHALRLAKELNQPDDQARAHDGLAHAYHALNLPDQARRNWQRALSILADLGIDQTDDEEANVPTIRAHLHLCFPS